jgi:NADPH:quinone reductase-like Zn-dependent oxidoreductase
VPYELHILFSTAGGASVTSNVDPNPLTRSHRQMRGSIAVPDATVHDTETPPTAPNVEQSMRALVQHRYGGPEVLTIGEVPKPTPGPGEVLVRVRAASVNARDWHLMRGEPRLARLDRKTFAWRAPRAPIRGTDFAGVVEAVGPGVTAHRPGDAVFGEADGALAEYVAAAKDVVAAIPSGTSFEHAAAIPLAANTALTLLRASNPQPGQRVLINGASGGVGTFAVQLAKSMELHVTAVCSARNADLVSSLGADVVLDYNRDDFCGRGDRYDAVLDLVGNRSLRDLSKVVNSGGTLVLSGGGVSGEGRILGPLGMLIRAKLTARRLPFRIQTPLATPSRDNLEELAALVASGAIKPVIDRSFAFEEAAQAVRHLETEHARAKVIVSDF